MNAEEFLKKWGDKKVCDETIRELSNVLAIHENKKKLLDSPVFRKIADQIWADDVYSEDFQGVTRAVTKHFGNIVREEAKKRGRENEQ